MQFYTTEVLSPNRELTPEGYLLCKGTRVARQGTMLYAAGEVPVRAVDGIVRIERNDREVFRPETISSFQAKPITFDHPAVDVNPDNWSQLTKGLMLDVRRGAGADSDFLVADLLISDAALIRAVSENEVRELSCGYSADYEEIEPGRGRQTNIVGNHLALVDKGRCGARCSIGDRQRTGDSTMKTKTKWFDGLRAAFRARDEAKFEETLKDEPTRDESEETEEDKKKRLAKEKEEEDDKKKTSDALSRVADALKTIDGRLAKLETRDAEEEETEEEKKKRMAKEKKEKEEEGKTGDSAALAETVTDVFARAEILSPGISLPTFDSKASPQKTRDAMCALRLKAVQTAFEAGKYRDAITPFLGAAPNFGALTCDAVSSAFIGASEIARRENNNSGGRMTFDGAKAAASVADSIRSIQAKNSEFWKRS